MGDAYAVLATTGVDALDPAIAVPKAKAAAQRALELDPGLADPHATLGFIARDYEWQWSESESELRLAIALNPSYAPAHQWLSGLLSRTGRHDEALDEAQRARILDPLSGVVSVSDAHALLHAGRTEEAIREVGRIREAGIEFWQVDLILGLALELEGRWEEALEPLERAVRSSAEADVSLALLGRAFAGGGRRRESTQLLDRLRARGGERWVSPTLLAGIERHEQPTFRRLPVDELQQRQAANRTLLDVAIPHLRWLSHWFRQRPHVIYLVDREGIVLHAEGDADAIARYRLAPGFDWSERQMGTNGAGTALAAGVPVAVVGCDHWSECWKDAVPRRADFRSR